MCATQSDAGCFYPPSPGAIVAELTDFSVLPARRGPLDERPSLLGVGFRVESHNG
jgi:hypothetical protein